MVNTAWSECEDSMSAHLCTSSGGGVSIGLALSNEAVRGGAVVWRRVKLSTISCVVAQRWSLLGPLGGDEGAEDVVVGIQLGDRADHVT